ncbi:hypothetical protein [Ensifer sp.]|uniref:hypothetical protein n=1 Tax=Ensifer sp. TaxID=1872086 RepID=UPI0013AF91F6|nr:hypothetical protein [Ensifer sp.]
MASLSFIAIGIGPRAMLGAAKIKNAALRRRRHYSHFAAQCQQNQALQCGRTTLIRATKKSSRRGLQKYNARRASWGKPRNRFGAIPRTLATESGGQ